MEDSNKYLRCKDIMERLQCSESMAYKVLKELNAELKKKGYMTLRGRVPKKYFEERFNLVR